MASSEEFDISRSSTLRSRLALAASCGVRGGAWDGSGNVSELGVRAAGSDVVLAVDFEALEFRGSGDAVATLV